MRSKDAHKQLARTSLRQPEAVKLINVIKNLSKDVKNFLGWLQFEAFDCSGCLPKFGVPGINDYGKIANATQVSKTVFSHLKYAYLGGGGGGQESSDVI